MRICHLLHTDVMTCFEIYSDHRYMHEMKIYTYVYITLWFDDEKQLIEYKNWCI